MDDIVDAYLSAQEAIFEHVGYVEDWRVIPLDDARGYYWAVDKHEREWCRFAKTQKALEHWLEHDDYGDYGNEVYEDEIYTQRHLPKWVYRGKDFTLVCCDTHTDGNQLLRIFRNDHEVNVPQEV
jgi:hypothetical protein